MIGGQPMRHVTRLRLDRSAVMLASIMTVSDPAMQVGYPAPSAFGRAIRGHFGHSPRRPKPADAR